MERQGREVLFKAWPYRNVAYSVWEFLRQQGVVWAAPEDHAEYVPTGKGVDLGHLPLHTRPSAQWREGGCESDWFSHGPVYWNTFYTDDTLFAARNGGPIGRIFPGLGQKCPPCRTRSRVLTRSSMPRIARPAASRGVPITCTTWCRLLRWRRIPTGVA